MSRARRGTVLLALAGAAAALLAGTRTWLHVTVTGLASPRVIDVSGRQTAPAVAAVALAVAAAAVVVATANRPVRTLASLAVAGGGVLLVLSGVDVLRDRHGAAGAALSQRAGLGGAVEDVVASSTTAWPAVTVAAGLLVAAVGLFGTATAYRWSVPTRRFERADLADPAPDDAWDSLSRGQDPT
jgi:hypothetical protein